MLKLLLMTIWLLAGPTGLFCSDGDKPQPEQGLVYRALVRAYLIDDQRIQWSGLENSFAAEAVLDLGYKKKVGKAQLLAQAELLVSQPFNQNILSDVYRERYRQNFEYETFSLRQLYIGIQGKAVSLRLGQIPNPFGRCFVPETNNARSDLPFIRTEAITFCDTGVSFSLTPGIFCFDLALVNGSEGQDTNSAKALVSRLGLGKKTWSAGVSVKYFGDEGSETHKMYNNLLGFDLMIKLGRLTLSGELIADQYGLHRPLPDEAITWRRSFYYRDIHYQFKTPIKGTGGYINLNWQGKILSINLNYGEYHPQQIGQPLHDELNRRLLASCRIRLYEGLHLFFSGLVENDRPREPVFSGASPYMYMTGLQFVVEPPR
jgi:hypothetical protein